MLGSNGDSMTQNKIHQEDFQYNDILQFEFTDSYRNCTLKSIGILRWTSLFSKSVKFIMKSDDDILINVKNLELFVQEHSDAVKSIYGVKCLRWGVFRNKDSKWYISEESYPKPNYPDFIVGANIMTSDCVLALYERCLSSLPALIFEDVYITGILTDNSDISLVDQSNVEFIKFDLFGGTINLKMFIRGISFSHDFTVEKLRKF